MQHLPSPSPLETYWSLDDKEALALLSCSAAGLSTETAGERLQIYGPNTLKSTSHSSVVMLFMAQFKSPITLLLIGAALLSMGLGDFMDALIILIIILISSILGFWQVIVKRLSSIENFGSMNVLCSDKTGTITEGKVTVKDALDITGKHSEKVLQFAGLNASLQQGFRNPIDEAICAVYKPFLGVFTVQCEIPYDFIRKRLTVQVKNGNENFAITKGALSVMLDICTNAETDKGECLPLEDRRELIMDQYRAFSAAGYRVLGVGYKAADEKRDFTREDEKNMIFLAFFTLFDPPKQNVRDTLDKLRHLGVQFKVITGDNALVADSTARQIGMTNPVILTGSQIRQMTDDALLHQTVTVDIFAEVEPNQKERIIQFLK